MEHDLDISLSRTWKLGFALLLGLLFAAFVSFNAGALLLVAEVVSSEDSVAQVFQLTKGQWDEAGSQTQPLGRGLNRITFRQWKLKVDHGVRFDPGSRAGVYRIVSLRWYRGPLSFDVPFEDIRSARGDGIEMAVVNGRLELSAADDDPQLLVPPPDFSWQFASLAWPFAVVAAGILALLVAVWRSRIGMLGIANAYLIAWLGFYFLLMKQHAPTLPINDDWRYVVPGNTSLIDGHWSWIKFVANDTYFLTGQVIDFIVLNLSNVDFAALRLTSLSLLLIQIWATHRVVLRSAGAATPWIPAVAIALIAWSLTSFGFWGNTAIAYHQFLPVLFGTLMLVHLTDRNGDFRARWSIPVLLVAAFASGLAYISGGLFILAMSAALLLAHADLLRRGWQAPIVRAGLLLFVLGAAVLLLQIMLVTQRQGSMLEHSHVAATVFPGDRRFWLFVFAQFGRALGYSKGVSLIDALLALLALAPVALLGAERLWRGLVLGQPCERRLMTALPLYAGIASLGYTAAVAFGRGGLVPPDAAMETILGLTKGRFHYWPVAALLPFLWLGWAELVLRLRGRTVAISLAVAVLMLVPKSLAPWDLVGAFRTFADQSVQGANCLATGLADAALGKPLLCVAITGVPMDMSSTIRRLHDDNRVLYRDIEKYGQMPPPQ